MLPSLSVRCSRDWNEEYQNVREMSAKDVQDRIVKAKILCKVLNDFGEAAVAGAMAVIQGKEGSPSRSMLSPALCLGRGDTARPDSLPTRPPVHACGSSCFTPTGFVAPINPNESKKSHVYVFNNIFFSHALDT